MAPEDRRAALVEATLPLLCEHGMAVTTRQIAEAAGVAEGTIFRAFPDKNSLLLATAIRGIGPDGDRPVLSGVDAGLDLRDRLAQAIDLFTTGMRSRGRLPEVAQAMMANPDARDEMFAALSLSRQRALEAVVRLLEPDAHRLRLTVPQAARIVLVLIFSSTRMFDESDALTSHELTAVVLDGVLLRPDNG